jgi:hypothetical protein
MTAMWGIYRTMFTDPLYRKPELEFTFETTTEGMMAAAITLSYWYYDLVVSVIQFVVFSSHRLFFFRSYLDEYVTIGWLL